jgi:hypothetical protein
METSLIISKVLQILSAKYGMSCSLEELTQLTIPFVNSIPFTDHMVSGKERQALILETLLLLNDQGLIFLNSDTDESVITIKGLLKINDKVLYN